MNKRPPGNKAGHCWQCQENTYTHRKTWLLSHGMKGSREIIGYWCTKECMYQWLCDNWDAL